MKVSFWIPKDENPQNIMNFIENEITEAKNIKSKETRKDVNTALTLMKWNIRTYGTGYCYYADETKLVADKYEGRIKKYHCGRDFVEPEKSSDYT